MLEKQQTTKKEEKMNLSQTLQKFDLFAGSENIEHMLGCLQAKVKEYERDEYILQPGETPPAIGVVVSGSVWMVRDDYRGDRNILESYDAGEVFGESAVFQRNEPSTVGYVAAERTVIVFLAGWRIYSPCAKVCTCHQRLIENLLSVMAGKNMGLTRKIEHLSCRTTREKLLSYLSEQARVAGKRIFTIPFDRQELADYLSVERSAMSAELSRMKRDGLIDFDRSSFKVNFLEEGKGYVH
jgi:CRP-like cAMP-binding protein